MIDRVGQQLGTYRLTRLLGHGGCADVYLSEHVFFNTVYAVKVWETSLGHDLKQDALAEARTIVSLKHPHIISVHYFDIDASTELPFLVMDYAPNGTLRQRHPRGTILSPSTIISYVKQVASALQYAHERNLIHRDIKPENMLINQQGDILLSDFGIAVVNPDHPSMQMQGHGSVAGTADYMAPELFKQMPCLASDQYSLGIVVYEWLCGNIPFYGTTPYDLALQHLHVSPPPLSQRTPELPPSVEQVVFKALAKDPERRFPTVQDFAHALEEALRPTLPGGISSVKTAIIPPTVQGFTHALEETLSPTQPGTISSVKTAIISPVSAQNSQLPPQRQLLPSSLHVSRRALVLAGVAIGVGVLAAGVWWQGSRTSASSGPLSTPTPLPTPIAHNGLITPGVLKWGADSGDGGAPYVMLDDNGAAIGFEAEIADAIARSMGISQEFVQTAYKDLEVALQTEAFDIILNGWEITPGREKNQSFSDPYYRYSQQMVVQANDKRFKQYSPTSDVTLDMVKHYRFGTGSDYAAADILRNFTGIQPHTSEVPLDDLRNGTDNVAIVMVDRPIVNYYVLGEGVGATVDKTLRCLGKPLEDFKGNYVIAFKQENQTLLSEINLSLQRLKEDGTLKGIYEKWHLWDDSQKDIGID